MKDLREKASQHATNEQTAKDLAEQLQAQLDATRADNQTLKRKMQSAKTDKVISIHKIRFLRFLGRVDDAVDQCQVRLGQGEEGGRGE